MLEASGFGVGGTVGIGVVGWWKAPPVRTTLLATAATAATAAAVGVGIGVGIGAGIGVDVVFVDVVGLAVGGIAAVVAVVVFAGRATLVLAAAAVPFRVNFVVASFNLAAAAGVADAARLLFATPVAAFADAAVVVGAPSPSPVPTTCRTDFSKGCPSVLALCLDPLGRPRLFAFPSAATSVVPTSEATASPPPPLLLLRLVQ